MKDELVNTSADNNYEISFPAAEEEPDETEWKIIGRRGKILEEKPCVSE